MPMAAKPNTIRMIPTDSIAPPSPQTTSRRGRILIYFRALFEHGHARPTMDPSTIASAQRDDCNGSIGQSRPGSRIYNHSNTCGSWFFSLCQSVGAVSRIGMNPGACALDAILHLFPKGRVVKYVFPQCAGLFAVHGRLSVSWCCRRWSPIQACTVWRESRIAGRGVRSG